MTGASPEYSRLYDEIDDLKVINTDLLAALDNLIRRIDQHFGGSDKSDDWKEQEEARAAIAKAHNS